MSRSGYYAGRDGGFQMVGSPGTRWSSLPGRLTDGRTDTQVPAGRPRPQEIHKFKTYRVRHGILKPQDGRVAHGTAGPGNREFSVWSPADEWQQRFAYVHHNPRTGDPDWGYRNPAEGLQLIEATRGTVTPKRWYVLVDGCDFGPFDEELALQFARDAETGVMKEQKQTS
jgi:hypothetical protein